MKDMKDEARSWEWHFAHVSRKPAFEDSSDQFSLSIYQFDKVISFAVKVGLWDGTRPEEDRLSCQSLKSCKSWATRKGLKMWKIDENRLSSHFSLAYCFHFFLPNPLNPTAQATSGGFEDFSFADAYDPISFTGARLSDARVWSFLSQAR